MTSTGQVTDRQQHNLLLSRFRSVAYAALGADVTEAELREALDTALTAHNAQCEAPTPPRLRAVPAT
jgi:hypothetical protein